MKKILVLGLAAALLASCGCSSWSCRKRYVESEKSESPAKQRIIQNTSSHPA